jgi:CheY-like chemotaxis protein
MLAVSGKGRFVTRRLDLSTVIDEMTHLLGVALSRDVTLRFQTTKGLPVVEADPVQIRQVVMNLVLNAAEALGTQPGEVTLATGLIDANREFLGQTLLGPDLSPGPYITLEVSDTGCGMDAATLPKIFDPFFTTKFPGRGLGLAAVLGIVRGHHGTLRVQSAVGKGTTFTILLPAAEARSPSGAGSPGTSSAEQLGGGTILLIDDEAEVRHVTQKMLERMGFTVLSADGGAAGLELFRQHGEQITCTLLDLTMPHLSGEEVFSLIRSLQAEARIVLMSGYSSADAGPRLASRGLAGFVEKPFTHVQLQERLRQALGRL